jgi:hypothetical protein
LLCFFVASSGVTSFQDANLLGRDGLTPLHLAACSPEIEQELRRSQRDEVEKNKNQY